MRLAQSTRQLVTLMANNVLQWKFAGTAHQVRLALCHLNTESTTLTNTEVFQAKKLCYRKFSSAAQSLAASMQLSSMLTLAAFSVILLVPKTQTILFQSLAGEKRTDKSSGLFATRGETTGVNQDSSVSAEESIILILRTSAHGPLLLIPGPIKFGTLPLNRRKMIQRTTKLSIPSRNQFMTLRPVRVLSQNLNPKISFRHQRRISADFLLFLRVVSSRTFLMLGMFSKSILQLLTGET